MEQSEEKCSKQADDIVKMCTRQAEDIRLMVEIYGRAGNMRRLDDYFAKQSVEQIGNHTLREVCIEKRDLPRLTLYNNRINAAKYTVSRECVFSPYRGTTGRLVYGAEEITTLYHPTEGFFIHLISNVHKDPLPLEDTLTVSEWLRHHFRTSLVSWDLYLESPTVHETKSPSDPTVSSITDAYMHMRSYNYTGIIPRPGPVVDGYSGLTCAYETFKDCMYEHHVPGVSNRAACSNVRAHAVDSRVRGHQSTTAPIYDVNFTGYEVIRDVVRLCEALKIATHERRGELEKPFRSVLELFRETDREIAVRIMTVDPLCRKQITRSDYGTRIFFHLFRNETEVEQKVKQLRSQVVNDIPMLIEELNTGQPDTKRYVSLIETWIEEIERLLSMAADVKIKKTMDLYAACRILRRDFGCETDRSGTPLRLTGHPRLGRNAVYYAGKYHTDFLKSFCLNNGFHLYHRQRSASQELNFTCNADHIEGLYKKITQDAAMSVLHSLYSVRINREFHFDPPADVYEAQMREVEKYQDRVRRADGVESEGSPRSERDLSEEGIASILRAWLQHDHNPPNPNLSSGSGLGLP